MSISVFEHPVLSGLLGNDKIAAQFSVSAEITAMLRFEAALSSAEAGEGVIPQAAAEAIGKACEGLSPDIGLLKQAATKDGVCVPELIRQLRAALDPEHAAHVHFGATSQDVIDTALVLRLQQVISILSERLDALDGLLAGLADRFGGNRLMAHTRMQQALPVRVADKIAAWRRPLTALRAEIDPIGARVLRLQLGGPVGTLESLGEKKQAVADRMAAELGLASDGCWHTDRQALVELAGWLSQLTGALGKIGRDVTLLAQNEVGAVVLAGGGGSSAMAHKNNPVAAEALVTLAAFNATLVSGMHSALVHEYERSGSAWTLEWMLLPQMAVAAGAALTNARRVCDGIEAFGDAGSGGDGR
ncbi:3-carboxy-cis,cis-muconate cycloisomerase [Nitratireductor sp. XY-223]|uniref:3-carboxy-cis,cis-muconate cycloisomerase n=1 Tax=Nitratireductor sp. XY-223 TaxID=2561926 RepID=UPI0010A9CDA8|nr:3-carboxy-cis,cis-muconate cycloisomerase [Nitratireductor sp. XY-223]